MKKIFISTVLLLMTLAVTAQTNYYSNSSGTIAKTGYTYKYRNDKIANVEVTDRLELYNASNTYIDVKWGNRDGSQMSYAEAMGEVSFFSNSSRTPAQVLAMVSGSFTTQQKTMLKGKSMVIELRVDPSTGKVADVYFGFSRKYPFVNIPVETYRSIELALKQNFSVTVTPAGKKLTYLMLVWEQDF